MICPEGQFATFEHTYVSQYKSHLDSIQNGIVPLYVSDTKTTLLIDTAAITYNNEYDLPMVIPSREGNAVSVPRQIDIVVCSNRTLYIDYHGYVFMK